MPAIIDRILRIGEGKIIRQLESIAQAVNAVEDDFTAMSDWLDLERVEVGDRGDLASPLRDALHQYARG